MVSVQEIYIRLQKAVEKAVGRPMLTPCDFDYLSSCVFTTTKENISAMTLKRFWGYLGKKNERHYHNLLHSHYRTPHPRRFPLSHDGCGHFKGLGRLQKLRFLYPTSHVRHCHRPVLCFGSDFYGSQTKKQISIKF